jgi:hypothetical protein
MIGYRQNTHPHFNRTLHQLRRRKVAVRSGSMAVEIVKSKCGGLGAAVCQKKYPAMAWLSIIPAIARWTEIYYDALPFQLNENNSHLAIKHCTKRGLTLLSRTS